MSQSGAMDGWDHMTKAEEMNRINAWTFFNFEDPRSGDGAGNWQVSVKEFPILLSFYGSYAGCKLAKSWRRWTLPMQRIQKDSETCWRCKSNNFPFIRNHESRDAMAKRWRYSSPHITHLIIVIVICRFACMQGCCVCLSVHVWSYQTWTQQIGEAKSCCWCRESFHARSNRVIISACHRGKKNSALFCPEQRLALMERCSRRQGDRQATWM